MLERRSVRHFSGEPVPRVLLENALQVAASAPSGANRQPWRFVVVEDPAVKARIRRAAEHEEELLYRERASREYLDALEPIGTDWNKPHLTTRQCRGWRRSTWTTSSSSSRSPRRSSARRVGRRLLERVGERN
jgi:nitroreductase